MNSHLKNDMEKLKGLLLREAFLVEENIQKSIKAIRQVDTLMTNEIAENDIKIDKLEVEIEEECLKSLALNQPVASDLRFVIGVLKINNELEHIGDMAVNISKCVNYIAEFDKVEVPFNMDTVASRTLFMLKSSLDAFITQDSKKAVGVCMDDSIIDKEHKMCYGNVKRLIIENTSNAFAYVNYLLISKSFERIADLCTNIAEDVIYMKHSIIARHNLDEAIKLIDKEQ